MRGLVFNIQRYSIHDGPGIRTVVFLKGCQLSCLWCCNPESQSFGRELQFLATLCQHCGACISACPQKAVNPDVWLLSGPKIYRNLCDLCGKCVDACPHGALKFVGEDVSVDEVLQEVLKDAPYYRRSGGGVTLSGGEPMGQPAFALALLKACYEHNIHTAIETTGIAPWPQYQAILPYTDLFLYDLKHMDSQVHRQVTGVSNERIQENLRLLKQAGAVIILRVPLIPTINTSIDSLTAMAGLAASIDPVEVHLMPFHQMGKDKYRRLDRDYQLKELQDMRQGQEGPASLNRAVQIFEDHGIHALIGG